MQSLISDYGVFKVKFFSVVSEDRFKNNLFQNLFVTGDILYKLKMYFIESYTF